MTNVLMPQMGESVAEGTIVRWIKQVGDQIVKDEPLFEISTDKVDAEIPAPEGGVLLEIRVPDGETVPVHTVVAVIGDASEMPTATSGQVHASSIEASADTALAPGSSVQADSATQQPSGEPTVSGRLEAFSSPVVRKIAAAHGIDVTDVHGTGTSGRVTKHDIDAFIARGLVNEAPAPSIGGTGAGVHTDADVRIEKMSVMRKKIADHMVASIRTAPHVYMGYEVDFGRVDDLRQLYKDKYESAGAKLTYTGFIAKATADAIREFPIVNASVDGDTVIYRHDINLGIAVALEHGLIVPVIPHADRLTLLELCRAIQDLAHRARAKTLKHDEVVGGTFTITNPGIFGAHLGLPIISQPQVAIVAVGAIERRAVVRDNAIVIRPTCYLTMGQDHRLIDGADGGRFLHRLKERLQDFDESLM